MMFVSRMCWYLIESIVPSTSNISPMPLAAKQAQSKKHPPNAFHEILHHFFPRTYICSLQPDVMALQTEETAT